jgi:peptidoglycan/xylan/chitin deacetylase (PgdA/CDA1 family)
MRRVPRIFAWLGRPQALIGFAAMCLCVGAIGGVLRSSVPISLPVTPPGPQALVQPSRIDCDSKPCLALTFDDGPNAQITPQILDILARQHVKATFFIIGLHVLGNEELLRREHREGHEIGNHTWNHPDLSKLSPEDAQAQIDVTQKVIAATGVPAPKILRPPYGAVSDMVVAHTNLTIVRWNTDPEDWHLKDPAKINEQLLAHARPGAIILMHDIYPSTVAALELALQNLKQRFQFVTASQLLNLSPGDQGQFFARFR